MGWHANLGSVGLSIHIATCWISCKLDGIFQPNVASEVLSVIAATLHKGSVCFETVHISKLVCGVFQLIVFIEYFLDLFSAA